MPPHPNNTELASEVAGCLQRKQQLRLELPARAWSREQGVFFLSEYLCVCVCVD